MTISHPRSPQGSATIYQFPVGGRAGMQQDGSGRSQPRTTGEGAAIETKDYVLVDAWYHQDAIAEAQRMTRQ